MPLTPSRKGPKHCVPSVRVSVPITHADLDAHGVHFEDVAEQLGVLIRGGVVRVAHNARVDLEVVLARVATRLQYDSLAVRRILAMSRFGSLCCAYSGMVLGNVPGMMRLCAHAKVHLEGAHDANVGSAALAHCVAEAWRGGVMLCYV